MEGGLRSSNPQLHQLNHTKNEKEEKIRTTEVSGNGLKLHSKYMKIIFSFTKQLHGTKTTAYTVNQ